MVWEMLSGLSMYAVSPAFYFYPWVLVRLVWMKNSGTQIPYDIPVVCLNDFADPNEIPGKDCPFAIDGERYYFTKQVRRDASRKRSKRKAGERGAYWKSTSPDIDIKDLNENLIGYMRKYTLYEDNKRSPNWCMDEYRVHNHHELDDPYVLCKIYEKRSACSGHTDVSIRSLTNRAIKRKRGAQPDQNNSIFVYMSPSSSNPENPLQTQFDNNDFVEDPIIQQNQSNLSQTQFDNNNFGVQQTLPDSESFPPNSLPIPRPQDGSGNQNRPESIPSIPGNSNPMNQSQTQYDHNNFVENLTMQQNQSNLSQTQFDNNNFGVQQTLPDSESFPPNSLPIPRPHDASGNQNHPESIPSIPGNSNPMNQSQTQSENNNFVEDSIMQLSFLTSENPLSDSDWPTSPFWTPTAGSTITYWEI